MRARTATEHEHVGQRIIADEFCSVVYLRDCSNQHCQAKIQEGRDCDCLISLYKTQAACTLSRQLLVSAFHRNDDKYVKLPDCIVLFD